MAEMLTAAEMAVLDLLAEASKAFFGLSEHHSMEIREWAADIHHLEERVMCRAAIRAYPEKFMPMRSTEPTPEGTT